jgi:xanthine dehydrogenase accessory factor
MREVTEALLRLMTEGEAGALATVVKVTGSAPQVPGARLLLSAAGVATGTIGGGAIEQRVLELLGAMLQDTGQVEPRLVSHDLGRELGMCCGGSMEIFIEPIRPRPRLWMFGAGHVAEPTVRLARGVGFESVVVDEREEWNTEARFPGSRRELADAASVLRRHRLAARDWVLVATHDHRLDEEVLRLALAERPRYIGLVGSRRKVYRLLQRVAARSVSDGLQGARSVSDGLQGARSVSGGLQGARSGSLDLSRVYAPVGLALGAETPDEIAVSIVAELVALRHEVKSAGHLRAVEDGRLAALLRESAAPPLMTPESAARAARSGGSRLD